MDAAFTLARYLARDTAAAEDIVQDAFLRAFRSFADWRGESAKAWLLVIVRNCFLNSVSTSAARASMSDIDTWGGALPPELVDCRTPESEATARDEAAMLRQTIDQLPEPFRETLILRELEELSYRDIAVISKVPVGTVMSRLSRARQMLADLILSGERREAQA